jgi:tetratricopeptide (TPR) repeat protein
MNRAERRRQQKKAKKEAGKGKLGKTTIPVSAQQTQILQQSINLALQHHAAGRLSEAESIYQQILQTNPNQPEALHLLGLVAHQGGKNEIAVDLINKAIAIKPDIADAHCNLGLALQALGKMDEAVACYDKVLAIRPDYAEAHSNLGLVFQKSGKIEKAVACYDKAIAINPDIAETHSNLGNALKNLGQLDEAVASHNEALAIKPDYAEGHSNLGNALKDLGKFDEAVASYNKAIAIKPDYAEAYRHLSYVKKYSEYDEDVRAMENIYAKSDISDDQRMNLAFGLGKAFEDLKQYEKAFNYYAAGNVIKRGTYSYSIEDDARYLEKQKSVFSPSFFNTHKQGGCQDKTPIFIVGMPRSGTTLVEQVLASHPDVHGAGELPTLGGIISKLFGDRQYPDGVENLTDADSTRLGTEYIREIRKHSRQARFITDKMPHNRHFLGVIKLALPNAKIIHCTRNPADNGLSIFKSFFPVSRHYYAYDLREIGEYYNLYSDLMEHWHSVIPGFIYDIKYEDMVANQIEQTRALLEFCGLEWNDDCIEFHKTDRPVATASATQVRRPIYKSSVQSWKRYEKQLAPMFEVLR